MDQVPRGPRQSSHRAIKVLIVDDDHYMRKVVRTMLLRSASCAFTRRATAPPDSTPSRNHPRHRVRRLGNADDGRAAVHPHGALAGKFPTPDVPIIMLTGHGDRWRVVEAARLGVHEYLLKPVSTKALLERIVAVLGKPRPMVQLDGYYGPTPRKLVVLG